jgi:hypothetical protein
MQQPMNTYKSTERQALDLLDVVDFKWLMAGGGRHVHVERMQHDAAYADDCLGQAAMSSNEALQRVAARLRAQLHAA